MADKTPSAPPDSSYRVLARKYRPTTFDDLIGQEPMVQTLRNAFESGRIAQAYILTGVRGVGKTTTARILARGLNFETDAGDGAPTVELKQMGLHCQAIMEGRHVDVIEMDAASHNGVSDIREITDAARYAPVSARFKVYLLDEVHMLSTAAFNALLKTLEEPPDHVKFIFATTEIGKVPVTILSRCQRFDLRRVDVPQMMEHLRTVAQAEGATVDEEALRLIARASEGSVRDALSILDQAIAHTGTASSQSVTAQTLREQLNLADQAASLDLLDAVMRGKADQALTLLSDADQRGADPAGLIADLAELVHAATRIRVVPDQPVDILTQENQTRLADLAANVPVKILSRAWQMLLKGLDELARAPKPLIAAEMIIVRLCYVADLPTPDEAIKTLGADPASNAAHQPGGVGSKTAGPTDRPPTDGAPSATAIASTPGRDTPPRSSHTPLALAPDLDPLQTRTDDPPQQQLEAKPTPVLIRDLDALIALADKNGNRALPPLIKAFVRPVSFGDNQMEIGLANGAPQSFVGELSSALHSWTGARWMISVDSQADSQTLNELEAERHNAMRADATNHPVVRAVMEVFPGAQVASVRPLGQAEDDLESQRADGDITGEDAALESSEPDKDDTRWTS